MQNLKKRIDRHLYSISTSIVLYFVLLICVVVLLVSTLSYMYTMQDFEQLSINYTESLIAEINAGVDSYIDNIKSMSTVICENRDVQNLLSLYNSYRGKPLSEEDAALAAALEQSAVQHMSIVAGTRSEITNVAVFSKFHDVFLSDTTKKSNPYSEYNLTDWFLKPMSIKEEIVVSPSHVQTLVVGEYPWVISISRAVIDQETGEVTGAMVIDLNFFAIKSICETVQLGNNGYVYILSPNKDIIYHPQQQLIYVGIKVDPFAEILQADTHYLRTSENKIYTKNTSTLTGWTAVGVINGNELMRGRNRIVSFYFTLSAVCLLVATAVALIISSSITKPIKQLESTMHRVENGDLTIQADTSTNNEIGHLGKTFNTMVGKIKTLMETAVSNEEAKRKSEINALQAQINPHFLYNTLDSIIWMSASEKNEEVTEMTAALAKLFRTSISQDGNFVPLRNEIENITSYLTIQKMRYGDKLSFELTIESRFLQCMVPKLILQPIVENALYHGIKLSPTAGVIRIDAFQQDHLLILAITDNGIGMSPEHLSHIFEPKENSERGIGVLNVHNRIQLCFGEAYGLHYFSETGTGTRVEIHLPMGNQEDAS